VSSTDPERQGDGAQPVWVHRGGPVAAEEPAAMLLLVGPHQHAIPLRRCCATPRPDTGVNERNSQDGTVHCDLYCRTCQETLAVITWRE